LLDRLGVDVKLAQGLLSVFIYLFINLAENRTKMLSTTRIMARPRFLLQFMVFWKILTLQVADGAVGMAAPSRLVDIINTAPLQQRSKMMSIISSKGESLEESYSGEQDEDDDDVYDNLDDDVVLNDDDTVDGDVQEMYIPQRLDHFLPSHGHNFLQRYFYSDRFVVKNGASSSPQQKQTTKEYAFLCVGGEGPALDKSVLVDSAHCSGDMLELASILHLQHGASVHIFALEHRYYGNSYPRK
jgi:hypothetical protein